MVILEALSIAVHIPPTNLKAKGVLSLYLIDASYVVATNSIFIIIYACIKGWNLGKEYMWRNGQIVVLHISVTMYMVLVLYKKSVWTHLKS